MLGAQCIFRFNIKSLSLKNPRISRLEKNESLESGASDQAHTCWSFDSSFLFFQVAHLSLRRFTSPELWDPEPAQVIGYL